MSAMRVALVGTADTKGAELAYVRQFIEADGVGCWLVDVGTAGPAAIDVEVTAEQVAQASGHQLSELVGLSRGEALARMADGAASIVAEWVRGRQVAGVLGLGGSGGASVAARVFEGLPLALPKLIATTQVSVAAEQLVRASDIMLMPTVADLAGLNSVTRPILRNAAHAIAGMVRGSDPHPDTPGSDVVMAGMIGLTTPGVEAARAVLQNAAYEVIVFHVNGAGGQAMERLLVPCSARGLLDATTVELADEVVGGTRSAGPDRFEAAGARGIPQVVSLGGLDLVRFGPMDSVPERFRNRQLHPHNDLVTLMRPTREESQRIGRLLGEKVARATGPTTVLVPMGGFSSLSVPGAPFHDPAADSAVVDGLRAGLGDAHPVKVIPLALNVPEFGELMGRELLENIDAAERRS